jgi:hypothetical protein
VFIVGPVDKVIGGEPLTVGRKLETEVLNRLHDERPRTEYGEGTWRIDRIETTYTVYVLDGIAYEAMTATVLAHDDFSEFA